MTILQRRPRGPIRPLPLLLPLLLLAGCSETVAPGLGDGALLELYGFATPDPATEGHLELWLFEGGAPHSAGRLLDGGTPGATIDVDLEISGTPARPDSAVVTLEPPGDTDPGPSRYRILRGSFRNGRAELTVQRAMTNFFPLEQEPGAHSLYTTSNNAREGYPSLEDAGMWLFNMFPATNPTGQRWVQLSQLRQEWIYEGWIVYRPGTSQETWISYGKFRPDQQGFLRSRDNTGSGPFSGDQDFRNSGVEEVPGDEWTTANADYSLPPGLELPLDLNELDAGGEAIWHHAITLEPAFDQSEPLRSERPFFIRPYGNPIGEGDAHVPRFIQYMGSEPRAVIRPAG